MNIIDGPISFLFSHDSILISYCSLGFFQTTRGKKKKNVSAIDKSSHELNEIEHENENESVEKTSASKSIKHHCKLCGAGFAQFNNFSRHLKTHNDHEMYFDNFF